MNNIEKQAMKEMHLKLAEHLDPLYLRGYLFQNGGISRHTALAISKADVRHKRAEDFLFQIVEECPMHLFLNSLKHKDSYSFLVQELTDTIKRLEHERGIGTIENDDRNVSSVEPSDRIPSIPNKVNVFTTRRNKAMRYKHMLKRLSHDGNDQKLYEFTSRIYKRWRETKDLKNIVITEKNKMADLVFMAYDSEVENRRVKYDCSLYKDQVFDDMLKIIPYTSEPKVASMTYLARYGSAITMNEPLDNGISYLQFARGHSDGITPCYESGIVVYIEHNLLVQKYQHQPDPKLKRQLIKLAEDAIFHFGEEDESLRTDYKRMLLLKIAFIHLGIGLFGENMDVSIEEGDLKSAKNCLDCVERPNLWTGMETRRKMFFHIAKSKYYEQQRTPDLALTHAKKAKKLANIGKFNKELTNIDRTITELNAPLQRREETYEEEMNNVMAEFMEEFPEDD